LCASAFIVHFAPLVGQTLLLDAHFALAQLGDFAMVLGYFMGRIDIEGQVEVDHRHG